MLGVRSAASSSRSPGPDTRLRAGDVLLVLASPEQLRMAEALARADGADAAP